jgi:peroxiredoxin
VRGSRCEVRGSTVGQPRPARRGPLTVHRVVRVALSATAALACTDSGEGRRFGAPAPVEVGRPAPAYAGVSLGGDSVSLAALRGKPVLLNIWATWCHPCREEIPELQRLHERYRERGLELVGVSVDAAGDDAAIRDFMRRYGMTYPVWRDPAENVSTTFLALGVPATFLIDRHGVLRWKKTGPIGKRDTSLTAAVESALVQRARSGE